MKDLEALSETKHFHTRIIQRHDELAFIAGSTRVVDDICDRILTDDACATEINRKQLSLTQARDAA